jgi:probable HAF family extracellular repeat protein
MKSGKLISAMALLVALAIPVSLVAKEHHAKHHKYKFVDLGTLGGPASYVSGGGMGNQFLNNQGTVGGWADTSTPDPNAPNCFTLDCFVAHALRWQDGMVTDLGAIADSSQADHINEHGWISGGSQNGLIDPLTGLPELVGALWTDEGEMIKLGTLEGGYESYATGVNDSGQAAGFASNLISDPFFGTQTRTFFWEKGVMTDVGTLGGPDSQPFVNIAINETGQVVGSSFTNSTSNPVTGFPTTDPFLWTKAGGMQDLGTLGGNLGGPEFVNNRGQVVGFSNVEGDLSAHPFLWEKGVLTDLGTLGGTDGAAIWINEAGDAVGFARTTGDVIYHAVLWKDGKKRKPTDLGTVNGYGYSFAYAINSKRQVVGCVSNDANSCSAAFLWEDGQMVDLNTLIPPNSSLQLNFPLNVNERGEIAGSGLPPGCTNNDLCGHLFLLIPCDDSHSDGGDCEERAEGPTVAQSTSAPVTQNPATTTEVGPSPIGRMGTLRGRLDHRYPHGVPQSGSGGKPEAAYITDEMPFRLSGHCLVNYFFDYTGECDGKGRGGACVHWDPGHCPPGKRAKQAGRPGCTGFGIHLVDPTTRCSVR